jgi:hypothetical protein
MDWQKDQEVYVYSFTPGRFIISNGEVSLSRLVYVRCHVHDDDDEDDDDDQTGYNLAPDKYDLNLLLGEWVSPNSSGGNRSNNNNKNQKKAKWHDVPWHSLSISGPGQCSRRGPGRVRPDGWVEELLCLLWRFYY